MVELGLAWPVGSTIDSTIHKECISGSTLFETKVSPMKLKELCLPTSSFRSSTSSLLLFFPAFVFFTVCLYAQLPASTPAPVSGGEQPGTSRTSPIAQTNPSAVPPSIPSLESSAAQPSSNLNNNVPKPLSRMELPNSSGQYWVEYNLIPYTQNLKNIERPQQAIIDWIIRETGSDVWFNEPMGILNADRTTLRVYHNAAMQKTVAQIYERFVNGFTEPQAYSLRLITVGNPNWRNKASSLMRSSTAQTPGVQAWLMPKENGAIFLSQLRTRSDVKEMQAVDIAMVNGQSQALEQLRSRNYLREYQANTPGIWPPYTPVSNEIREGYKLNVSPLMSLDGKSVDLMLKCDIDQVERLNSVMIDLPMPMNQPQSVQIDVPQLVSWRLHERFRWPSDQVLLLSCGVVAAPAAQVNNTLLGGNTPALFGLNRILPASASQRTDALLMIEYRGPASTQLNQSIAGPNTAPGPFPANANNAAAPVSRGRY
jgi:hypothetical protein